MLIEAGADVNKTTKDGRTPGELLKVEMSDRDRNDIVKLLGEDPLISHSSSSVVCAQV